MSPQHEHRPPPRPRRWLPSAYDLAKVAFFVAGLPRNGFGSIDVTGRCNLRCRHCYHFAQDVPEDLPVPQWIALLQQLRRATPRWEMPFFNCSWVGGEPLLRPKLIERGRRFFRYNTVVTNGTIALPHWPDVNWYVSIDGDEPTHDRLRGCPGSHSRARRHVAQSLHLGITIASCITRENAHCIERVVEEWAALGAKHITFDFHTPTCGVDDPLWVPLPERDRIIDRLLALRRRYGDFFVVPPRVFELMRSASCRQVTDRCQLRRRSFALDAGGRDKGKCVMGEQADCDRCGCVVPYYLHALTDRRLILRDLGHRLLGLRRPPPR